MIPPRLQTEFVWRMETVLETYCRPYDPSYPVVCLDESPKQLLEINQQRKADGTLLRDYEYRRKGVSELYMAFEPLAGFRLVFTERDHTSKTWVRVIVSLLDGPYRNCTKLTLVGDNHSAHRPCGFYECFPPEQAKAYLDRLEFVFTPKHGSWLDMAEIELSVLSRDCKGRCFATVEELRLHLDAWQERRNNIQTKANWQFTTHDARTRLRKLYPTT